MSNFQQFGRGYSPSDGGLPDRFSEIKNALDHKVDITPIVQSKLDAAGRIETLLWLELCQSQVLNTDHEKEIVEFMNRVSHWCEPSERLFAKTELPN